MTTTINLVRGSVKLVTCQACGSDIPLFEFDMETDTDGIGLCSAARCNQMNIVIAETTLEEWKAMKAGELRHLPLRLAKEFQVSDFHVLHIKRIDQQTPAPTGTSFAEFKKNYRRPIVVYDCPCCEAGEGTETEELTVAEFEKSGGRIFPLGNLVLQQ
jgi:hypothetical protein